MCVRAHGSAFCADAELWTGSNKILGLPTGTAVAALLVCVNVKCRWLRKSWFCLHVSMHVHCVGRMMFLVLCAAGISCVKVQLIV